MSNRGSKWFRAVLCVLMIGVAGCRTVYVPAPGIPNVKEVPDFDPGLKVSLVNAQPSTEEIALIPGHKSYYANLHDWTERLNRSLKETLKKKRVEVAESASKSLKVSIDKAVLDLKAGGFNPRCTLKWKVETGDGTVIPMTLETGHWKVEDASNVAVRLACRDTLRNEQVRSYLSGR